jgi:hypothetical protein
LAPTWVSATQVGAGVGSAFIESLGYTIDVPTAPANITPTVGANTWYHVYLYLNGSTPTLESSSTAPVAFASPAGTARSKSGDTSRRYLYSFRTDGSSNIRRFAVNPGNGFYSWEAQTLNATPFRVLSAGSATSATPIDCSAVAATTATSIVAAFIGLGSGNSYFFASNDYTVSSTAFSVGIGSGQVQFCECDCSSTQNISYICFSAAPAAYVDVAGFYFSR